MWQNVYGCVAGRRAPSVPPSLPAPDTDDAGAGAALPTPRLPPPPVHRRLTAARAVVWPRASAGAPGRRGESPVTSANDGDMVTWYGYDVTL